MNKQLLVLSTACLLIVASCKKSNSEKEETNCQLTEMALDWGSSVDKILYTYDDQGRVKKMKYADENYDENYTYSSDQITEVINDGDNAITTIYKLDGSGKIVSSTTTSTKMSASHNHTSTFTYNNEGQIIEWKRTWSASPPSTITMKYTYTNGNLTTIQNGQSITTIAYGTDEIKDNFYFDLSSSEAYFSTHALKKYFGKVSKNLFTKSTYESGSDTFVYKKDNKGQITEITVPSADSNATMRFKYECK